MSSFFNEIRKRLKTTGNRVGSQLRTSVFDVLGNAEQTASNVVEKARQSASNVIKNTERSASGVIENAERSASGVIEKAGQTVSNVAEKAGQSASKIVQDTGQTVSGKLEKDTQNNNKFTLNNASSTITRNGEVIKNQPLIKKQELYIGGFGTNYFILYDDKDLTVICSTIDKLEKGYGATANFIFGPAIKSKKHPFHNIGSENCFNVTCEFYNAGTFIAESPEIEITQGNIYHFSVSATPDISFHLTRATPLKQENKHQASITKGKPYKDSDGLFEAITNKQNFYLVFFVKNPKNISKDVPIYYIMYGSGNNAHAGNLITVYDEEDEEDEEDD